jgi:hypothetical protein
MVPEKLAVVVFEGRFETDLVANVCGDGDRGSTCE